MQSAAETEAIMKFWGQMRTVKVCPLKVLIFITDPLRSIMEVFDNSTQSISFTLPLFWVHGAAMRAEQSALFKYSWEFYLIDFSVMAKYLPEFTSVDDFDGRLYLFEPKYQ